MALIILLVGIGHFCFGELILKGAGVGWDGKIYRDISIDFHNMLIDKEINAYRLQRVLPSAIIHYTFRLFSIPLETNTIMMGFRIYNLILLVIAAYLWGLICSQVGLSMRGQCLGFIGLFINFAVIKYFFIYPMLTDQTAFFLGVILLFFFLKRSTAGIIITSIIGMFSWPLVTYYGLTLLGFRYGNGDINFGEKPNEIWRFLLAAALVGLVFLMLKSTTLVGPWMLSPSLLYLSVLVALGYIFLGAWDFFNHRFFYNARAIQKQISWRMMLIAAIIFLTLTVSVAYWGKEGNYSNLWLTIPETINRGVGLPAIFLVGHFVFFGPVVLLILFFWKPMLQKSYTYGLGFSLVVLINFVLSLASESRILLAAFPFFVLLVIQASEQVKWKPSFFLFMLVLSLIFSKIWYRMNLDWKEGFNQAFYMNFGFTMSWQMYAVQGGLALFAALVLYVMRETSEV